MLIDYKGNMEWVVEEGSSWSCQHLQNEGCVMCFIFYFALRYIFEIQTFALRYMRYRCLIYQFLLSFPYSFI